MKNFDKHKKYLINHFYTVFLALGILFIFSVNTLNAQTFPTGFSQVKVAQISNPSVMCMAPDGRIFVAEQGGKVNIIKNGSLLITPFVQLNNVVTSSEHGLVGLILDPNFATNGYVYLYHTTTSNGVVRNQIVRVTANGDVALGNSQITLLQLDALNSKNFNHDGGAMRFGTDGKLYVAVGDNYVSSNGQNLDTYLGKILRINSDGSAPSDNPYTSGSEQRKRIYAYGVRNPFTFHFQPGTNNILVNDVGLDSWEEINKITGPGQNFGWPYAEGKSNNTAYINPIYAYPHGTGNTSGCAISGGVLFTATNSNYPSEYLNDYFYMDFCNGWLNHFDINSTPFTIKNFASGLITNGPGTGPLSIEVGNDGNLYYLVRSTTTGVSGLYKLIYSSSSTPVITKQPESISVSASQTATFSVSTTGLQPITFQWQKNSVNIAGATSSSYSISNITSANAGNYRVVVTNPNGSVTSNEATLTVTASNSQPVASITSPINNTVYRAGNTFTFSGTAIDNEDGSLPATSFSWSLNFHHGDHVHDSPPFAEGLKSGSFTIPSGGETAANVYYGLLLIVKDSKGLSDTAYVSLKPKTSTLSLATNPTGLQINLDDAPVTAPYSVLAVSGMTRKIGIVSPQTQNGKSYEFTGWANGGNAVQDILITDKDTLLTANFKEVAGAPDLIVTDISWNPATPVSGNNITFSATVKNQGLSATPSGTIIGVAFSVNGNVVSWSDNNSTSLAAGSTIIVTASGGPNTVATWRPSSNANYSIVARVDDIDRIPESNETNNSYTETLSIGATSDTQAPTAPSNLSSSLTNSTAVTLTWSAATDNVGVAGYDVYRGETKVNSAIITATSYQVTGLAALTVYNFTVRAVDAAGNISPASNVHSIVTTAAATPTSSVITFQKWNAITGNLISSLTSNALFPNSPSSSSELISFEAPVNSGDNYGARIIGYLTPTTTGQYYFWVAGDDNVELWLSTDNTATNKRRIAYHTNWTYSREWNKFTTQKSVAISLTAGNRYYIEALLKEGTGGDNLAVGWRRPSDRNGTSPVQIIPGSVLSPFVSATAAATTSQIVMNGGTEMSLTASEPEISLYPNPTSGEVTASFEEVIKNIKLLSSIGTKVLQQRNINANSVKLNVHHLIDGMYILQLDTKSGKQFSKTLIIEK